MKIEGVAGPNAVADGTLSAVRLGKSLEQMVSELQPRYFEQAYRGNVFSASSAAGTSSAGLAATFTGGICLSNPAGSNKLLVPLKCTSTLIVVSAAVTSAGLIVGYSQAGVVTHTTALVPFSNYLGSGVSPVGKVDQAATLVGTPAWLDFIASTGVTAGVWGATLDLEGDLVIPPGGYVAIGTTIASPATAHIAGISWIEVPV